MVNQMATITRIFSQSTLKNILTYGYDEVYNTVVAKYFPHLAFNSEVFASTYEMIRSSYRNKDYIRLSTFLNGGVKMYFPYLRGRQYELIALREMLEQSEFAFYTKDFC